MSQSQDQGASAPQDLDLLTLAATIWRRRGLFSLVAAVVLGAVLGAGALLTPVYESEAVVQVGLAGPNTPIEPPGDILGRLRAEYAIWRGDRPRPRIERVEYLDQRNAPLTLRIVAEGLDPASAQRTAAAAAEALVAGHAAMHASRLAELERLYQELDVVFQSLAEQRRLRGEARGRGAADLPLWATLAAEAGAQEALPALTARLALLGFEVDTVRDSPTRITFAADLPASPARPSWPVLGIVGILLGLMSATLVVLGLAAREAWLARQGETPA